MNDPQVINNQIIQTLEQPQMGTIRQPRPAARFEGTPAGISRPAPRIGEHTHAVLAEAGYTPAEIDDLLIAGAAIGPRS